MKKKISVEVFCFAKDHQDGSGSCTIYNNKQDYIDSSTKYSIDKEYHDEDVKKREQEWEDALLGDEPYEKGTIEKATIDLVNVDGRWVLVSPIHFSWGQ